MNRENKNQNRRRQRLFEQTEKARSTGTFVWTLATKKKNLDINDEENS